MYVGSNPTGENRCLVVKAVKRHLPSVHMNEEDMESAGTVCFRKEENGKITPSAAGREGRAAGNVPVPSWTGRAI